MRIQQIAILPKYNYDNQKPINIPFEARVDKGLTRFYEANAGRMPQTVKTYIETIADKTLQTPLNAQKNAFAGLIGLTSVAAVQETFPDENLFSELKEADESKATRGLLGIYRENKELLKVCEQGILNNNENFTIWLLKKIFLESKTLDEINQDLEKEINPEFKTIYDEKEDGQLIHSSTLRALGIKLPEAEYLQSLRYTRLGYSDMVGEKISIASRNFWDSMPIEERTARNKKSVERFETWWNSMSRGEKLDLIAEQVTELEMLEKFNKSDIGKTRKPKSTQKTETTTLKEKQEKTQTSLSRDDLFKIWAGNNLKLFMESLTDYDKRRIEMRREQKRAEWWNSMSAQQRTEYINGLKAAAEPIRYAMIDAWNKNPDILAALSIAMKKGHIEKPVDAIYGTEQFNEHLSQVMTDFWSNNPKFAERWGIAIREAHEKVKEAVENGRFDGLKRDIMKARAQREKEVNEQVKNHKELFTEEEFNNFPPYLQKFINLYMEQDGLEIGLLPREYLRDFFNTALTDLTEEQVISWSKALNHESMSAGDYININKINDTERPTAARMNRALEAALADVLFDCTEDPRVYLMSQADCKMALSQIIKNYPYIAVGSLKLNQELNMPIINRNIDSERISELYAQYKEPITSNEAEWIVEQFIKFDTTQFANSTEYENAKDELINYVMLYGSSCEIIFDLKNQHSIPAKKAFAEKFMYNFPDNFPREKITLLVQTTSDFEREKKILNINNKLKTKYNFIPQPIFETLIIEVDRLLRQYPNMDIKGFEEAFCQRIKSSKETIAKCLYIDRDFLTEFNHFAFLSIEQTFADTLYKITGEPKVYALTFEELLETIESVNLIKKYRNEKIEIESLLLNETFSIQPKAKTILYKSELKSQEYNDEMINYYLNSLYENKQPNEEEILFILNPEENKPEIDKYTEIRIKNAKLFN